MSEVLMQWPLYRVTSLINRHPAPEREGRGGGERERERGRGGELAKDNTLQHRT